MSQDSGYCSDNVQPAVYWRYSEGLNETLERRQEETIMSLEQDCLYLEQLESGRVPTINKHSDLFSIVEATRLRNHWTGGRQERNSASARLYPLGPVIFEKRRWDCFEVEVPPTCSSEGTSGVCLWVGRRIPKILFEGRDECGVRDPLPQSEGRVDEDRRGYFTVGGSGVGRHDLREMLQPSREDRKHEQDEDEIASLCAKFASLAIGTPMEVDESKRSSNSFRC